MVLSLIKSYGLMSKLMTIPARKATYDELNSFHSSDFLNHCLDVSKNPDHLDKEGSDSFGLGIYQLTLV
jgi:acetoin utilization deacetylase AcuC-like enzyme